MESQPLYKTEPIRPVKKETGFRIEDFWSPDQLNVLKNLFAPDLTPDELVIFGHICKRVNLDPFARQIYAIKRGGKMCIQTGIDGFRLIAERTGCYAPGKDTEFFYDEQKRLTGAKAYVKKYTSDGTWHDISATAFLSEYNGGTPLWKKMPHVMLEKVGESRALRRAFPADLSGLYSDEEMEQAEIPPTINVSPEEPSISRTDVKEWLTKASNTYDREELLAFLKHKSEQLKRKGEDVVALFSKNEEGFKKEIGSWLAKNSSTKIEKET